LRDHRAAGFGWCPIVSVADQDHDRHRHDRREPGARRVVRDCRPEFATGRSYANLSSRIRLLCND
jgi:hypothetical protein